MLEGGGVVGAVHNALVADDFVVHILVLDGLAVAVKLHHAPLGAEGEEDRQVAEVVEMVVYGWDAEGAEVRDYHGAVEGADPQQGHGDEVEIVHNAQDPDCELEKNAGYLHEHAGYLFRAAVVGDAYLFDGVVHFTVDVVDGVGGLENDLGAGLLRLGGDAALHHHVYQDLVARIDPLAGDEAVEAGQLGNHPYIGGDKQVQHAQTLVALLTLGAQPAVRLGYLNGAGELVAGVVAVYHYVGLKHVQRRQGAQAAPLLAVPEPAMIV